MWEMWVRSLGWEDALEKGKATHSNIVAWRIPWTVAHQAPLSLWTLPGKNTGVGFHALFQGSQPRD